MSNLTPPLRFLMIYPNASGYARVPMGILILLELAEKQGYKVDLFDITFSGLYSGKNPSKLRATLRLAFADVDLSEYGVFYESNTFDDIKGKLKKKIDEFKPNVVGFSVAEENYEIGLELCDFVKSLNPEIKTIFGGVFCITCPEDVIVKRSVDFVCNSEGEIPFVELLKKLENNESADNIPGIWSKGSDGEIINNNKAAALTDLNVLPYFDFSKIDERHMFRGMAGHVYKTAYVESIRGCPNRCNYCCNQIFLDAFGGKYIRKKNMTRLVDELEYYKKKYGFNLVIFSDDDFFLHSVGELREFKELYNRRVGLPFWTQIEARNATEEKIVLLKESGCFAVSMGIETGNEKIRTEVYKRKTSPERTIEVFDQLHKIGFRTSGNVIIGVPYEGREEIFDSIELVKRCNPTGISTSIFVPFKGTELRRRCIELGYLDKNYKYSLNNSDFLSSALSMPQITKREIDMWAQIFPLYAMLPEKYYPQIEKCETLSEDIIPIFNELKEIYWDILKIRGINYDVPGFDYDGFLAKRKEELTFNQNRRNL